MRRWQAVMAIVSLAIFSFSTKYRLIRNWFCADEMSHRSHTAIHDIQHPLVEHSIGIGGAFALQQMLQPGFNEKALQEPAFHGGILEHAPRVGSVTAARLFDAADRLQEA